MTVLFLYSVYIQIPAGDIRVLAQIDLIIGIDIVQPQYQAEKILRPMIGGKAQLRSELSERTLRAA